MNRDSIKYKDGIVYVYTSPNGKQYVGQTWYPNRRIYEHSRQLSKCPAFYEAVRKYGYENLKYEVLHEHILTQEEMDQLEIKEIAIRNTLSPHGYNLSIGGSTGIMCEESRNKISKARMGMQFTEKHRANLRKAKEYISPETRQKMRDKKLGRKLSSEQCIKISKSNTGKHMSAKAISKRVWSRHLSKQRYIRCMELNLIFDCPATAVIVLGGNKTAIAQAASGKLKTSGGYHWEYMD